MDRGIKLLTFLTCLFAGHAYAAQWTWEDWGFKPNVGFDVGRRTQSFEKGLGEEHFRRHYPETNLYIGTKMFKYLGLELGYENRYRLDKNQYYGVNQPTLGFSDLVGTAVERLYLSDASGQGVHFSLEGYFPICPRTKTELTATLGIAWIKMYYNTTLVQSGLPASAAAFWESDRRALPRLGLGVRQMITNHFGVRLQGIWEDTSKLEASLPVPISQGGLSQPLLVSDSYTVKPKDSYTVSLGFFLQMT